MLVSSLLRSTPNEIANAAFIRLNHISNSSAFPPVFWAVPLIALLSVPVSEVVSRAVENTVLPSTITYGWEAFGELVLPLGAGICAACVAGFRNPMHSLLALLGVFFCTAVLYLIAGLAFVGVVFLIVYVGAVAVLFLFVIMLLNVKSLTSDEELLQHWSQIVAIVFAIALLAQIFFTLGGAFDHLLAIGFLLDAVIEPTTGEAISFFVRFLAMDINRLTGLYTTHGITLLLTTGVLLVALLGAIILATVTTERATSISDLRQYPKRVIPRTVFLSCALILSITTPTLNLAFECIALWDLDPILLSHYLRGAERDVNLRSVRKFKQDTYALQSYRFSAKRYKYKPFRECLQATDVAILVPESDQEDNRNKIALRRWKTLTMSKGPYRWFRRTRWRWRRQPDLIPMMTGYFAKAVLAPLLARRYRPAEKVLIMRRRWLWRWRRDRAAWLRRVLVKRTSIRSDFTDYYKAKLRYPRWPAHRMWEPGKFKYHYYRRIVRRIRPALRLFGKRRMPFFKFLHLMFVTKVYSRLFHWAWRLRAFCLAFICFFFFVPPFITFAWLFVEEQNTAWETLTQTYTITARVLHDYTDLRQLDMAYSQILAVLFYVPMLILRITTDFVLVHILIALAFAWDSVTSHGGELSDTEFHESRCNYWRKRADDFEQDALIEDVDRPYYGRPWLLNHPDKGRTDVIKWIYWDSLVQLPPPFHGLAYLGGIVDILAAIKDLVIQALTCAFWLLLKWVQTPAVKNFTDAIGGFFASIWKVCSTVVGAVREGIRLLVQTAFDNIPFLAESYDLALDVVATVWVVLNDFGKFVWSYIYWGFYTIEYTPKFLKQFLLVDYARQYYTAVVLSIMVAVALYFIAVFVILLPWKRVYGKSIERPLIYPYIIALVISLYFFGVLGQYVKPHQFDFVEQIPTDDLETLYFQLADPINPGFYIILNLVAEHPYAIALLAYLIFNFLRQMIRRRTARRYAYFNRPYVFRAYYNYYLRGMHNRFGAQFRLDLAKELGVFSSTEAAHQIIVQEAKEEEAADDVAAIEEAERMIWMRITYVPSFYDPHPNLKYRKDPWPFAYVVENHYDNPHHAV